MPMTALRPAVLAGALALAGALGAPDADAHRFWLLPSMTVLSGEGGWITVDAARSNDMFHFNHNAMQLDGLQVTAPGGAAAEAVNRHTGELRSVFDVALEAQGTYRIAVVDDAVFARYEAGGRHHRWQGTAAEFADEVPGEAEDLRVSERINRAEIFVTAGAPTRDTLEPVGRGLELIPETHPNDLYAGETARFRMLVDGEPAAGIEIEVIPGGVRYRDTPETMTVTTGDDGAFEVTWPEPGMYYLETGLQDEKVSTEVAPSRRLTYVATLEVLPM